MKSDKLLKPMSLESASEDKKFEDEIISVGVE